MTAAITDFSQFAELRRGADNKDPAVLREVAGQFEALFLQSMLKSMRDASLGDPLFGDSDSHEMYQGMLDQQLAVEMSTGKGIGLADMLVRQLGGKDIAPPTTNENFAISRHVSPDKVSSGQVDSKPAWTDPESFARDVWPHAQRVARALNVPAVAVMAQAALETGWGKYVMEGSDGSNSFNLFGIKANTQWTGGSVTRQTLEYADGVARKEVAQFRAYDDVAASFDDYRRFLTGNPRYAAALDSGSDVEGFANAIAASGYATDPAYAEKLSRVADSDTMSRVLAPLKNTPASSIDN